MTALSEEIERLRGERDHLVVKLNLAETQSRPDAEGIERLKRSLLELEGMIAVKMRDTEPRSAQSRRRVLERLYSPWQRRSKQIVRNV